MVGGSCCSDVHKGWPTAHLSYCPTAAVTAAFNFRLIKALAAADLYWLALLGRPNDASWLHCGRRWNSTDTLR